MVTGFFWTMLNSSSEDAYTLNDKVAVQSSVTSLMNIIQQDVQEAKIMQIGDNTGEYGIMVSNANDEYKFGDVIYTFDSANRKVIRVKDGSKSEYDYIYYFSMSNVEKETQKGYGVSVSIKGSKVLQGEELVRTRYDLSSTYYTRNTR